MERRLNLRRRRKVARRHQGGAPLISSPVDDPSIGVDDQTSIGMISGATGAAAAPGTSAGGAATAGRDGRRRRLASKTSEECGYHRRRRHGRCRRRRGPPWSAVELPKRWWRRPRPIRGMSPGRHHSPCPVFLMLRQSPARRVHRLMASFVHTVWCAKSAHRSGLTSSASARCCTQSIRSLSATMVECFLRCARARLVQVVSPCWGVQYFRASPRTPQRRGNALCRVGKPGMCRDPRTKGAATTDSDKFASLEGQSMWHKARSIPALERGRSDAEQARRADPETAPPPSMLSGYSSQRRAGMRATLRQPLPGVTDGTTREMFSAQGTRRDGKDSA